MSAEEFRIENNWSNFQELTPTGIRPNYNQIEVFAEAYHKSKVEAITDEDINENKWISGMLQDGFVDGAKWFKEKLLKQ